MPKDDLVRKVNLPPQRSGSKYADTPIVGDWGTGLVSDSDRVDGFHASLLGLPGTIPVLDAYGHLPESTIPEVAGDAPTGHKGRQYIGPTAYLQTPLSASLEYVDVSNNQWTGNERVILSHWSNKNYETVLLTGTPSAVGPGRWRYPIQRALGTVPAQDYPVGTVAVSLGDPAIGGYIVLNSAGGPNTPRVATYQNDPANVEEGVWKGAFGKLSGLPDSFTSLFSDSDFTDLWGVATDNGFFTGSIHAYSGSLYNLSVEGTIIIKNTDEEAPSSWMELGKTVSGFGWSLRNAAGPAILALAPYLDDNGVISPIAFIINHGARKGLYYHELADGEGRLEIMVDTFIGGNLRVGETFIVGTGNWTGTDDLTGDFAGVAINSEWGLLGRADHTGGLNAQETMGVQGAQYINYTQEIDIAPGKIWEIFWDKKTGKFFTGGGAIGFGRDGMSIKVRGSLDRVGTIKWFEDGTGGQKIIEIGSDEPGQGYFSFIQDIPGKGQIPVMTFGFDTIGDPNDSRVGLGMFMRNNVAGTNNIYIAPAGGTHKFYIGSKLVSDYGAGMPFVLPVIIDGTEADIYFAESGRIGINTVYPTALLDIVGGDVTPQFQIRNDQDSAGNPDDDLFTRFRVGPLGTTWSTSGNIVLGPATNAIIPYTNYGVDLGAPFNKFGRLYAAQLEVETLVAEARIATVGGRIIVAPTMQLTADTQLDDVFIYTNRLAAVVGDTLLMEGEDGTEAMLVTDRSDIPSGEAPNLYYQYVVDRGLGTTSPLKWMAGSAIINTGQTGAGWIDLFSTTGLANSNIYGPSIVGNVRLSSTWNNWKERWAIGNLNGVYGYADTTYGVGFGNPAATHITIDDVNGYRIFNNTTVVGQWNTSGELDLFTNGTAGAGLRLTSHYMGYWSGTEWLAYTSDTGDFLLNNGTSGDYIGLSTTAVGYRIWIGNPDAGVANFSVTPAGIVNATGAVISGTITITDTFLLGTGTFTPP